MASDDAKADICLEGFVCPLCLEPALGCEERRASERTSVLGSNEVVCGACGERMPVVLSVPYLGRFMTGDLLSVLEVTSYLHDFVLDEAGMVTGVLGSDPALLGRSYARIQGMIDTATDREGTGVDFPKFGFDERPRWFTNRYEEFVQYRQVVDGLDFAGKRVLDIGAGTGFDSLRFHRAGADVTALEYNPLQAGIGRMNFSDFRWIGGSVTHMPFPDGHFDIVIANCALHHVLHLEDGLREMLRVLKVGGSMLTIGDSYGPNRFTIENEVAVFNRHPAVLRGVNEQVPRFERFVSPLAAFGDALEIELMTAVVHGLHKNTGTLERWDLEEGLATLGNYRGGLCMRVLKKAPTRSPERSRKATASVVPVGDYVDHFTSREGALRYLARAMPDDTVDRPILDHEQQKLRLLLGWRQPEAKATFREGVGNAYLFVSPGYVAGRLGSFDVLVPKSGNGMSMDGLQFELRYDDKLLALTPIRAGRWTNVDPDLEPIAGIGEADQALLSFHIRDRDGQPTDVTFRICPDGASRGGMLHHIKEAVRARFSARM